MATPDYTKTELDISRKGSTELPNDLHLYTNLQKLFCNTNNSPSENLVKEKFSLFFILSRSNSK